MAIVGRRPEVLEHTRRVMEKEGLTGWISGMRLKRGSSTSSRHGAALIFW